MGIAQMGIGTLIINVFPFRYNFPPKSLFGLIDLIFVTVFCLFCCYLVILVYMLCNFLPQLKFKSDIINCVKNLSIFAV